VARLCERPGCSIDAHVAYGFDAEHLVVWLDVLREAHPTRFGVLCRRHADAMVVPLGWMLDDRREPTPRLFRPADDSGSTTVGDITKGTRRPRSTRGDSEQLSFDSPGSAEATVVIASAAGVVEEALAPTPAPGSDGGTPDARATGGITVEAPALEAPALEAPALEAPAIDGDPGADVDAPLDADVEDEADGPADAPVEPWRPRFDQRDDLEGLLKARGRLLSRAFSGLDQPSPSMPDRSTPH
jgi:hypothetical protein